MDNDTWHRMMDAVITQAYLDPESAASPPPAKAGSVASFLGTSSSCNREQSLP